MLSAVDAPDIMTAPSLDALDSLGFSLGDLFCCVSVVKSTYTFVCNPIQIVIRGSCYGKAVKSDIA